MGYKGTTKLVTLSIGVVWTAVMLRIVGPTAYVSLSDWLPRVYVSLAGWLTPPYLYVIINGIILSIAASSRFSPAKPVTVKASVPVPVPDLVQVPAPVPVSLPLPDPVRVQIQTPVSVSDQDQKPIFEIPDDEEEFVIMGPRWDLEEREEDGAVLAAYTNSLAVPVRTDSMEVTSEHKLTGSMEKPPVSARFSRKSVRPSPEGNSRFTKGIFAKLNRKYNVFHYYLYYITC